MSVVKQISCLMNWKKQEIVLIKDKINKGSASQEDRIIITNRILSSAKSINYSAVQNYTTEVQTA